MFSARLFRLFRPIGSICALALVFLVLACGTFRPAAADEAIDAAYSDVAGWLFEQYLQQAIRTMTFNVKNASAEAGRAVEAQAPSMRRFLSRHRSAFVAALLPILKVQVDASRAVGLAKSLRSAAELEPEAKQQLAAVDTAFRLDEQRVLRALTFDLRILVEDILQTIKKPQQ